MRISENEWFRPKFVDIALAPLSRKASSMLANIMIMGLNFASQEIMTAVKPRPPDSEVDSVWSVPETSRKPTSPHIAPDRSIVRIMTFSTFMPT